MIDYTRYHCYLEFNWASEASPTLGFSIEISRDIYVSVGRYVCRVPKCVGGITWPKHAVTSMLFISGYKLEQLEQGRKRI